MISNQQRLAMAGFNVVSHHSLNVVGVVVSDVRGSAP
jgi:hypothetical protein